MLVACVLAVAKGRATEEDSGHGVMKTSRGFCTGVNNSFNNNNNNNRRWRRNRVCWTNLLQMSPEGARRNGNIRTGPCNVVY